MRRSRLPGWLLAALALLASMSACAQILGDDFVMADEGDDDGSSSSSETCDGQGDCDTCLYCGCDHETQRCFVDNPECSAFGECAVACADTDCLDACAEDYPDGVDDYYTWNNCGCFIECPTDCAVNCST